MLPVLRKYIGNFCSVLLLGLSGYILNLYELELFYNLDFVFGGIFAVLAIKKYGYLGILSALIAAFGTYVNWNHPYAMIIFTAEAAAIAHFSKERDNIILVDTAFWLTAGPVLILIFYSGVMGMDFHAASVVYLKQSINGIINALIASVIICSINIIAKEAGLKYRKIQIRSIIFETILLITILPVIFYVISNIRFQADGMLIESKSKLTAMTNTSELAVNNVFKTSYDSINILEYNLRDHADDTGVDISGEEHITAILSSSDTFIGLGFVNRDHRAAPIYVYQDRALKRYSGNDYSDRPYYAEADKSDQIVVTEARKSNLLNLNNPILILAKSMRNSNGSVIGYLQGGIQFDSIYDLMTSITKDSGIFLTLTDRNNKPIVTTNPAYEGRASVPEINESGIIKDFGEGIYLRTFKPKANTSVMTRWNGSDMIKSVGIKYGHGITLTAEMPMKEYIAGITSIGLHGLTVIFASILLSVAFALFISKRAAMHFKRLSDRTAGLSCCINSHLSPEWPVSIFSEVTELTGNFRNMEDEVVNYFRKVTEQKNELEIVLDSIPLIVFMKDTKNNVVFANREARKYASLAKTEKKPVSDLFVQEYERFYFDDKKVIETKKPVFRIFQTYPFESGTVSVVTDKIPLIRGDGSVRGILVISRDITEELKTQEDKQKTLEMLYQQSKMAEMGAMIGAIAHQWKQPLNSISLLTQIIEDHAANNTVSEEAVKNNTEKILKNINLMSQTVTDFTGFFKKTKEKENFRPCETVSEIYNLLEREFVKNNIEVRFHDHRHFTLYGVKNEFKQVCLNLLNNSKSALIDSQTENKRIDVYYEHDDLLNKIIIEDNAGGIPEHLLPTKLFEMYTTTKDQARGSGLGLYICKSIIETQIGGKIIAENTITGARFTIMLPSDKLNQS